MPQIFQLEQLKRPAVAALKNPAAALILAAVALIPATATPAVATDPAPPTHRVPFRADFEDAERRPMVLPSAWDNISRNLGFSGFGTIALEREEAESGAWSLAFRLDGDSLVAGSRRGRIPVFPRADYTVTGAVHTKLFDRARVRFTAVMLDATGAEIEGTRAASPLISAEQGFKTIELLVTGDDRAAEMRVELHTLQPRHQGGIKTNRPLLDDLDGVAFFDSIVVRQRPTIRISTAPLDQPGPVNAVFVLPAQPILHVVVRDLSAEPSHTTLTVRDLDGRTLYHKPLPSGATTGPVRIPLPITEPGWYNATLAMLEGHELPAAVGPTEHAGVRSIGMRTAGPGEGSAGGPDGEPVIGQRSLAFVVLPPSTPRTSGAGTALGVRIPPLTATQTESLPSTLEHLGSRSVHFDLWTRDAPAMFSEQRLNALRRTVERLMALEYQLTFGFREIPAVLAAELALDPPQILDLLASPPDRWRPHLDPILVSFALRIQRWSFGSADLPPEAYEQLLPTVLRHLKPLIPSPRSLAPMRAEHEGARLDSIADPLIVFPSAAVPNTIESWIPFWPDASAGVLHLEIRNAAPRVQALDLILRGLYAWRTGLPELTIDAPWNWNGDIEPTPAFLAWRGLSDLLQNRRFVGELPLGSGRYGWLMEGLNRHDHALLIFRDDRPGAVPDSINLVLGEGPLLRRDAFGKIRSISPQRGRHHIVFSDVPAVIEGINLNLARFRASFTIAPTEIPALHQVHETEITLTNPWPIPISGKLAFSPLPGFDFTPPSLPFSISPGGTFRAPLSIIFRRGTVAGKRTLHALAEIRADQDYRVQLASTIDVGWKNIQIGAAWRLVPNPETGARDLIVQLTCTNRGMEPVDLEAFATAPGVRRLRRALRTLSPGETANATFVIADGAGLLAGRSLRYGVSERGGAATLSRLIEIPVLTAGVPER